MSEKNLLYKAESYQEKDGMFRGVIVGADERPVIWTERTFKTSEQAERNARGIFRRAIFHCNHEWSLLGDEHSEDTEFGGTEYVSHSDCKKCGLRRWEVNDRSIYEDQIRY